MISNMISSSINLILGNMSSSNIISSIVCAHVHHEWTDIARIRTKRWSRVHVC
jgi:hypothetical protein